MNFLVDFLKSDSGYFSPSETDESESSNCLEKDEQFPSIIFVPLCFDGIELAIMECNQDKIYNDHCKYNDVQIISCSELEFERGLLNKSTSSAVCQVVQKACQLSLIPFHHYTIVYPRKKIWFAPNYETNKDPECFSQSNPRIVFVPLCARGSVINKCVDDNENCYFEDPGDHLSPQIICCSTEDFEKCLFENEPELVTEVLKACNSNILETSGEKQYTILCPQKMWWVPK